MWYRKAQIQADETGGYRFQYQRNPEKAPYLGETYGQDIEPHGKYMTHLEDGRKPVEGWEQGVVDFVNPLIISWGSGGYADSDNWKQLLNQKYKKRGRELSLAIIEDGHDGIITVDDRGEPLEIIDLRMFRSN